MKTTTIKEVMKEDGLEDIDNLYMTSLNDFYYNNKHTTEIINIVEENASKIQKHK